jgi:RNA polymerase sigma factor (sigma-70 family)
MQPRLLKHPARLAGASLLRLQDDKRLVALAREGHDPAFAAIVDRYGPQLERYCARLLGPGRAEDAVQQAFVNAHAAMRTSDQELALKPWLYRIAHNAALNILRAAKDEERTLDEDRPSASQTADIVELREQLRETLASIQALPAAQRDALLLREIEGRSHEEIAAALGVSAGGARQHLHRARITVRAAASAITPYPLIARVLTAAADEGGRGADVVSGAGLGVGAGAMKAAAGVFAAGALAGGAVTVHNHATRHSSAPTTSRKAANRSSAALNAANSPSAVALNTANHAPAGATPNSAHSHGRPGARAHGHSGATVGPRRHGSSEIHHSGGSEGSAEHKDSTEHHGSSGGSGESSGSGGSGDDGLSHSGSGSSGSGSDDTTTTATSGGSSSGSGSTSSGSDDGTSSDSSGPGSGTSTTPLSDDHSGPGGGSDDPITTVPATYH